MGIEYVSIILLFLLFFLSFTDAEYIKLYQYQYIG